MSLSGSLFNGVSGLQTAQRQINLTSGNVSNANVEGYSQKTAAAVTRLVDGQNSGVDIGPIRREVDAYLDSEAMRARTELGALNTRSEYLNRVSDMFGTLSNDSTLANGLNALSSALEALSIEPESASTRRDVVEAADAIARQLNTISAETTDLRAEASNEIDQGVSTINDTLASIAELNDEISRAEALGRPSAELQDERDRQLETLSGWMDISTFNRENGAISVMGKMANGSTKMLVDSGNVQFDFSKASALGPTATANDGVPVLSSAGTPADAAEQLGAKTGGKLGALLDIRDNTLTDFHRDIDRLAQTVRDRVNAAHNQGTYQNEGQAVLTGAADVSADTFSAPASGSLTVNFTNSSNDVIGSTTVSVAGDASVADIQASLAGTLDSVVTGDGQLELSLPAGAPAGSTGFTIDTGTAEVESELLGKTRGFSHYFGFNNLFETPDTPLVSANGAADIAGTAGDIQLRSDIKEDPSRLSAGVAAQDPGPPPSADPDAVPVGDGRVAQAMADAFADRGTVAKSGGNLRAVDTTMTGYAGDILSFQASETARTDTARDFQQSMYDEMKFRSDSKSGVNIDEELSNMLVFEQSYNASARVISTVQQMFDTLDRMMN